jgi:uncharacterized membrane protein YGL010W
MGLPSGLLKEMMPNANPLFSNWVFIALVLVNSFYLRLSLIMGYKMMLFSFFCLLGNYLIGQHVQLWLFSILLFSAGWIAQFYGHRIEGKKPSFLKDLQFLSIGPAWVIENMFSKK